MTLKDYNLNDLVLSLTLGKRYYNLFTMDYS